MYIVTTDQERRLEAEWFPPVQRKQGVIAAITGHPDKARYTATIEVDGRMASSRQLKDVIGWMKRAIPLYGIDTDDITDDLDDMCDTLSHVTFLPGLGTYQCGLVGNSLVCDSQQVDAVPNDVVWRHAAKVSASSFRAAPSVDTEKLGLLARAHSGMIRAQQVDKDVTIEYAIKAVSDNQLLDMLNEYSGDQVWQDIVWDYCDHTSTDVIDPERINRFITHNGTMIVRDSNNVWRMNPVSHAYARIIDELPNSYVTVIGVLVPSGESYEYRELLSLADEYGDHDWTVRTHLGHGEFTIIP